MHASHARILIAAGAKVILTDVNEQAGKILADELGENTLFIKQEVTKAEEWANVVKEGEEEFGPIKVQVNNAGNLGPIARTVNLDYAKYLKVIKVNQHALF